MHRAWAENTIDGQYTERGQLQCQLLLVYHFQLNVRVPKIPSTR